MRFHQGLQLASYEHSGDPSFHQFSLDVGSVAQGVWRASSQVLLDVRQILAGPFFHLVQVKEMIAEPVQGMKLYIHQWLANLTRL